MVSIQSKNIALIAFNMLLAYTSNGITASVSHLPVSVFNPPVKIKIQRSTMPAYYRVNIGNIKLNTLKLR